jgi:molecular chaperone GrpE
LVEDRVKPVKIAVSQSSAKTATDKLGTLNEHGHPEPLSATGTAEKEEALSEGIVAEDELEAAKKEAAENRDRWMRAVADLENFKKRSIQEKSKLLKYKFEELLRDLLTVVDSIGRALGHCEQAGRDDAVAEGVCMISEMFQGLLSKYGVTEIDSLGKPFDPNVHEALAQVPMPDREPNTVIEVMEKGYMYHDRLLRPSKVVVSGPPAAAEGNRNE